MLLNTLFYPLQLYGVLNHLSTILIIVVIIYVIRQIAISQQNLDYAHWSVLVEDFKFSSQKFYQLLSEELKSKEVEAIMVSDIELYTGVGFEKRLYMRVQWKEYTYDCCCAPFGTGTFFSWWLYPELDIKERILLMIPWVGVALHKLLYPRTYYKRDTMRMFMAMTHASVLEVVDKITKESGYRIPDQDRVPSVREALKRD